MPVRIYALAKELKLDSKDLVDLCTKIGIANKGSALASLEDDEVARIRKYLAGSAPEAGASSGGPTRAATGNANIGAPIREPVSLPPLAPPPPKKEEPATPAAKSPPAVTLPLPLCELLRLQLQLLNQWPHLPKSKRSKRSRSSKLHLSRHRWLAPMTTDPNATASLAKITYRHRRAGQFAISPAAERKRRQRPKVRPATIAKSHPNNGHPLSVSPRCPKAVPAQ